MIGRALRELRRRHPRVPGRASIRELLGRPVPLPADLGAVPGDHVRVEDAEALRHLGPAGASGRASDLLRPAAGTYRRPPDPSALFEARHAAHAALPPLPGRPLRILTFNVALLDRTYLGQRVCSPHIDARREALADAVFGGGWDIVLLQEVWSDADADRFRRRAADFRYAVHTGERRYNHGLFIAVRSALVGREERAERLYDTQYHLEGAPGPSIRRGLLRWTFDSPEYGRRITVFDTHTSAFPWASTRRNLQARRLGGLVGARPDDEIVFVGGDLNAGFYYERDRRPNPYGDDTTGWWRNAASLPLLLHYGGLDDMHNLAGPAEDVVRGSSLPGTLRRPGPPLGDPDWCPRAPRDTFTATECNSLYFQQYPGAEFPARIDHLLLRDPGRRVRVQRSEVVFQDRRDLGLDAPIELSDHYGVSVTATVG